MNDLPLLREAIQPRIDGIQKSMVLLQTFGEKSVAEFADPEIFERAAYHLRLALEGVFHISAHILSRIPGSRETEYKRMAKKLGEMGIVDREFANTTLVQMAGYRNRLTHFYAEVQAEELHVICKDHLQDIEKFLQYIKKVMQKPEDFGLSVD